MNEKTIADVGLFFRVAGIPRAQPRGRHVGSRVVSTTGPAKAWRRLVTETAKAAVLTAIADGRRFPLTGAVQLTGVVIYPTTDESRWGDWRIALRDRDASNVLKLLEDAAVDAGAMVDDGHIAKLGPLDQIWGRPDECGVSVSIIPLRPRRLALEAVAAPWWLG